MTSPTQTSFPGAFTICINHDYKWEWEEVADDYASKPEDIVATNIKGRKAVRHRNTDSNFSSVFFHNYALQQIHDDRFAARQVINSKGGNFMVKPDLAIIAQHMQDAVIPGLTDSITSFECEEYPQIAEYLNLTYGLTKEKKP